MILQAWVALKPGLAASAEIRESCRFCKQRLLPYKYPRAVEYLGSLPKTGTGKIIGRR